MSKLKVVGNHASFRCPGCKGWHSVRISGEGSWGFNGDVEKPTFTPSILTRSGHYIPESKSCWCEYYKNHPEEIGDKEHGLDCFICHSFVTDGKIQFLGDCTHALANQTVDLPDLS